MSPAFQAPRRGVRVAHLLLWTQAEPRAIDGKYRCASAHAKYSFRCAVTDGEVQPSGVMSRELFPIARGVCGVEYMGKHTYHWAIIKSAPCRSKMTTAADLLRAELQRAEELLGACLSQQLVVRIHTGLSRHLRSRLRHYADGLTGLKVSLVPAQPPLARRCVKFLNGCMPAPGTAGAGGHRAGSGGRGSWRHG